MASQTPALLQMIIWTGIGFISGSLPFSVWIGRLMLGKDIRQYGDANPGATNVIRAGGKLTGALALVLDAFKAFIPVAIAIYWVGIDGWLLVPVALAPVFGHAYSPFLHFRGGKALACTLGIWTALTMWEGPVVGGLLLVIFVPIFGAGGWSVVMMGICMFIWFLLAPAAWNSVAARPPTPVLLTILTINIGFLAYRYRDDLSHPPAFRRKKDQ